VITTDLKPVIKTLNNDDVVGIPTETVYGLAGNAYKESTVEKIFNLKKRPAFNPLIVHIASPEFLTQVATDIPSNAHLLAEAFWPGPLTLVLNKKNQIPDRVTAGKPTVAVRVPNHPLTLELLSKLAFPLTAPSANPFGSISPTTAAHVQGYFKGDLKFVLEGGPCLRGLESTIVGFDGNQPVLYRHGALALEEIEKVVGKVSVKTKNDKSPNAPGMLSRHYAPKTATILSKNPVKTLSKHSNKKVGLLSFQKIELSKGKIHQEVLSTNGNLEEAAKNLYAALHRLDQRDLDLIIAPYFPDYGLGKTMNDRMQRAIQK
jgi:L-threonylcarbamoyladenylate synthase